MNISQPYTDTDSNGEKKVSAKSLYCYLRSKALKLVSSAINLGVLSKLVLRSGLGRTLWILTYIEKIQGGHEAFNRKLPFDNNLNPLPWYTYPGIEFLQQFQFLSCNIFEFGSGNSSLFWSKKSQSVISVESDPDWYTFGIQDLSPNRTLLLKTECNEYVETILRYETQFDVIVIDGLYRYNCAVESMIKLKDGGIIVLDNSDWFPDTARLLRDAGFTQTDFIGAGPVNSYAWCTSVFFRGHMSIPRISDSQPVRVLGGIAEISLMDKPC